MTDVFDTPQNDRWFEDYTPGAVYELGEIVVDEAELVSFAARFDPQPMHLDGASAQAAPFGGLIASGWHTAALAMRLVVQNYLSTVAARPSPGVDELRWHRPVRPGDTLRVRATVTAARASASKPDLGIVHGLVEVRNGADEPVMSMRAVNLFTRRPHRAATAASP
ncbi:MaoC family dehydratase [Acetobacteraceae bacterium KSS8]|uniref:MaoC family dehydratase n=1 Tax=Endosaccharibacter trunci TaxID=2812733 RepID=A0ABT1WCA5_9PROT|nr:MaoC family dehydratase [Acetobacteraceae bacterium KSS8]